jgi:hypothetical protein
MSFLSDVFSSRPSEFGAALAEKIAKQFPPSAEPRLAQKGAQRRLEGVLAPLFDELDRFRDGEKPSWIGKARIGNAFRWKMLDAGYSKEFVEALTEGIILRLASTPPAQQRT